MTSSFHFLTFFPSTSLIIVEGQPNEAEKDACVRLEYDAFEKERRKVECDFCVQVSKRACVFTIEFILLEDPRYSTLARNLTGNVLINLPSSSTCGQVYVFTLKFSQ